MSTVQLKTSPTQTQFRTINSEFLHSLNQDVIKYNEALADPKKEMDDNLFILRDEQELIEFYTGEFDEVDREFIIDSIKDTIQSLTPYEEIKDEQFQEMLSEFYSDVEYFFQNIYDDCEGNIDEVVENYKEAYPRLDESFIREETENERRTLNGN